MMKKRLKFNIKKLYGLLISVLSLMLCVILYCLPIYAIWGTNGGGKIYWLENDNSFPKDGWHVIDENGDGIGYYYYFDENGYIFIDDITPDYQIVNAEGKRIDFDGNVVEAVIDKLSYNEYEDGIEKSVFSEEIMEQIKQQQGDIVINPSGFKSSGTQLFALDQETVAGPSPSDNIVIEQNADGTARTILGPNVVLRDKKESSYDTTIDKKMDAWIKSGDKYEKNKNGTTYNKSKWKGCMALKGTGATIVFENPKNNFNKLKGRIATHHFTYTETTTICTLNIVDDDNSEILYSTSDFNYNSGCSFSVIFPRKTKAIRFELEVSGQYTSRVCYLRDCVYAFDKAAYEEELYDDETERLYRENIGTDSEATYYDDEEDFVDGEWSLEGEDPGARYKRINNISDDEYWINFDYDEDDDTITEAMKASISEARARYEAEMEKRNQVSGPAFDENLKNIKETLDPLGNANVSIISGKAEEGE